MPGWISAPLHQAE
uniref:Uncharacterized protein n=1 Tax=Arundo donax TaxID=35708 RepID=A0A0A9EK37_ARUDO